MLTLRNIPTLIILVPVAVTAIPEKCTKPRVHSMHPEGYLSCEILDSSREVPDSPRAWSMGLLPPASRLVKGQCGMHLSSFVMVCEPRSGSWGLPGAWLLSGKGQARVFDGEF